MKQFFFACALLLSSFLSAQAEQFVDSIILSGLPLQVIVENETQTPIIVQQYSYVGLDRVTGDSLWTVQRKGFSGIAQKMSENHEENVDIVDIPSVPFVFIRGVVVDVRNGKKIISEDEEVKLFRGSHLMAEDDLILLEVSVKAGTKLFGFSPKDGSRKFVIDLAEKPGLALGGNARASAGRRPMAIENDILYFGKKNIYRIDLAGGKLVWSYDEKVKDVQIVNGGESLLLKYAPGGLMSLADYDKTIQILDAVTGKPTYKKGLKLDGNLRQAKDYDGGLLVIHSDGMNVFDFGGDEDGRWKKGFKEGGIKRFELQDDGMMVYFKNKRQLIDPVTGSAKTKKAEKLDRVPYTGAEPRGKFMFAGKEVLIWGSNSIEIGGEKIGFSRIAFDADNGRIITAQVHPEKTNLKKGIYGYTLTSYNVKTKSSSSITGLAWKGGLEELEVVDGRIIGSSFSGLGVQQFLVTDGELTRSKAHFFNRLVRKGEKTAKTLNSLLGDGGGDETPESIPGYISGDSNFYYSAIKEGFNSDEYPNYPATVRVILGRPNIKKFLPVPYLVVVDKKSGEELMRDLLIYNNAQYTLDKMNNLVYVIHGKSIRWYQF
jgi:hypothetical protein